MKLSNVLDLHEFSPVKPNDQVGTAFEGVRVSCNTPSYKPGNYTELKQEFCMDFVINPPHVAPLGDTVRIITVSASCLQIIYFHI